MNLKKDAWGAEAALLAHFLCSVLFWEYAQKPMLL